MPTFDKILAVNHTPQSRSVFYDGHKFCTKTSSTGDGTIAKINTGGIIVDSASFSPSDLYGICSDNNGYLYTTTELHLEQRFMQFNTSLNEVYTSVNIISGQEGSTAYRMASDGTHIYMFYTTGVIKKYNLSGSAPIWDYDTGFSSAHDLLYLGGYLYALNNGGIFKITTAGSLVTNAAITGLFLSYKDDDIYVLDYPSSKRVNTSLVLQESYTTDRSSAGEQTGLWYNAMNNGYWALSAVEAIDYYSLGEVLGGARVIQSVKDKGHSVLNTGSVGDGL